MISVTFDTRYASPRLRHMHISHVSASASSIRSCPFCVKVKIHVSQPCVTLPDDHCYSFVYVHRPSSQLLTYSVPSHSALCAPYSGPLFTPMPSHQKLTSSLPHPAMSYFLLYSINFDVHPGQLSQNSALLHAPLLISPKAPTTPHACVSSRSAPVS